MTVKSERAEQSESRANRALAHFRAQAQHGQTRRLSRGLRRRTRSEVGMARTFQSHDGILRLVAIAEEFSITRFVDVVEVVLPSDPLVSALWDAELDRSSDTWPKRDELWKRYKDVNLREFPRRGPLNGFIEARNSISHGLGRLTRRQLRKREATTERLLEANIHVQDESLVIDTTHVEQCATVVKAFIDWLDARS